MHISFPGGGGGVSAAEIWHTKVRAGAAFSLGYEDNGAAALFSWVQLLNPAASGVNAVVYAMQLVQQTTLAFFGREYDTAGTNLVGNGVNCRKGGAASVCELRWDRTAAQPGTETHRWRVSAAFTPVVPWPWVFELAPGQGFVVSVGTVQQPVGANFWWYEE